MPMECWDWMWCWLWKLVCLSGACSLGWMLAVHHRRLQVSSGLTILSPSVCSLSVLFNLYQHSSF